MASLKNELPERVTQQGEAFAPPPLDQLEQPPSLWKLPRELVAFAQVASRTCHHEVVNTIGRYISPHYSTQRESVIDVIDIRAFGLLETLLAVVTLVLLPL